jgi:hypothetical protein
MRQAKTMLQSVKGIYKQGQIELLEIPNQIEESPVIVTFLTTEPDLKTQQLMYFGMFGGANQSTENDFFSSEFHGDSDDNLDWS